ncbi:MAG TPA: response regulator [Flavobacteriales bacterium]|nr:response regulator [Flavobacteriales bacterium]HMR28795.1 response regulator [Flavobacteriales bacterium]
MAKGMTKATTKAKGGVKGRAATASPSGSGSLPQLVAKDGKVHIAIAWRKAGKAPPAWLKGHVHSFEGGPMKVEYELLEHKRPDLSSFDTYLILAELDWYEGKLFGGYHLAEQILLQREKPATIIFLSLLGREELYDRTHNLDRFFVKSFPHYQLPLPLDREQKPAEQIELFRPSSAKWRYLQQYGLREKGVLDQIAHALDNALLLDDDMVLDRMLPAMEQMQALPDLADEKMKGTIAEWFATTDAGRKRDLASRLRHEIHRRIVALNSAEVSRLRARRNKPRVMLLEDDDSTRASIKGKLDDFVEVDDHADGREALMELREHGVGYRALLCDLSLNEPDTGTRVFEQSVQGVDVLEYAQQHCDGIVTYVITEMGRQGVSELQLGRTKVLYKSQLVKGGERSFNQFIADLLKDIALHEPLRRKPGPNNAYWGDRSSHSPSGDDSGGGYKTFYYDLKLYREDRFKKMWEGIVEDVQKVMSNDPEIRVSCEFGKEQNAKSLISDITDEVHVDRLQRLLTHRMIMLASYGKDEVIDYKKHTGKLWWGWKDGKPRGVKNYFTWIGLGRSTVDNGSDRFRLKRGQLFKEEIAQLNANGWGVSNSFTSLWKSNESLCEVLYSALEVIHQHQALSKKRGTRSIFNENYSPLKENYTDVDHALAKEVLTSLSKETYSGDSKIWTDIFKDLEDVKYDRYSEQKRILESFDHLDEDIQRLLTACISKLRPDAED